MNKIIKILNVDDDDYIIKENKLKTSKYFNEQNY